MLFPSNIFLFCFFPALLFLYFIVGNFGPLKGKIEYRNILLLAGSLIFYAYGEKWLVLLLICSILWNYGLGLWISRTDKKKLVLILAVLINISVLFVFKYLDFTIFNIGRVLHQEFALTGLKLPIGISFFTFQALSYVIDVYRGKARAQKNPFYVGLYISLFPQLIAGPIVRYESIAQQMVEREESFSKFSEGTQRFLTGLAKKVLLADGMALFADRIFNHVSAGGAVSAAMAWLGALCYTLQIYYDFSGYSDMAIGLGKMFGFTFEENFDHPYIAENITQFWRRWHISLSSWFRDYVYIPLGGNRKGTGRLYLNLFIVWILTGIWHGAGWTFVLWGLLYFAVLSFEKASGMGTKWKLPKGIANIYAMLVVIIGWVLFRSESLGQALDYLKMMIGIGSEGIADSAVLFYLKDNWFLFLAAIIFVMPVSRWIKKCDWLYQILLAVLFMVSLIYIWKGGYSPFIYFSF